MLTVYIDFKSAPAYLAFEPTLALADRVGLEIRWAPYRTAERDIPDTARNPDLAQTHHRVRIETLRKTDQRYAALRGIDLQFPKNSIDTDLALSALCGIEGDPAPFIRAAFSAYWDDHSDLNDQGVVENVLAKSGVTCHGPLPSLRSALETAHQDAEELGVVDAPAYLIGGHLFIGRAHLPWIEEIANAS